VNKRSANAIESAGLGGRRTVELDAVGEGTALLVEISTFEMLDSWRRARAAVSVTRRWPVLITTPEPAHDWMDTFTSADPFSRWFYGEESGVPALETKPSEVMRRAELLDLDGRMDELVAKHERQMEAFSAGRLSDERARTESVCREAPPEKELGDIVSDRGWLALERHLLQWEATRNCKLVLGHEDWWTPPWPVALALLPVPEPWATYAYVNTLFGTDHDLLVSVARRWYDLYGAQPVAAWGTSTDLIVDRRPDSLEEAFRLAVYHYVLAMDTLARPGIALRWHARALLTLDHWHLYNGP
jgi:hypothetical protein